MQILIVREGAWAKEALITTRSFHFYPSAVFYDVSIYHSNLPYCLMTASSSVNNLTIMRCFINALTISHFHNAGIHFGLSLRHLLLHVGASTHPLSKM